MRVPFRSARPFAALVLAITVAGCDAASRSPEPEASPAAPPTLRVSDWPLPAPDGAAQPDLVAAPDGTLLLSWIEPAGEGHVLRFARHGLLKDQRFLRLRNRGRTDHLVLHAIAQLAFIHVKVHPAQHVRHARFGAHV